MTNTEMPVAVGAYIFAGGFTLGVSKHFRVIAHLEASKYGVQSAKANFPGLAVHTQPATWPVRELKNQNVKLLYCNPPCALFSQAGATMRKGTDGWKTDPRQKCWRECFLAFEGIFPDVFVLESVVRAYTAGREFVTQFTDWAKAYGYAVTHVFVDAQNHGMAQRRKRYFLVVHKINIDWTPPVRSRITANEILSTITDPGYHTPIQDPEHARLISELPVKTPLRRLWERDNPEETWVRTKQGVKGRPRLFIHRVDGNDVLGTIAGDYFIHPTEDRFLGMNELKALNGFPPEYFLEGSPQYHASLLCRGVCPPVAEWLAGNIRRAVDRNEPAIAGVETEVDFR